MLMVFIAFVPIWRN